MKEKEIKNIVFYKFESETGERIQTCIFYEDGTILNTDQETGKEIFERLKKQKGLNGSFQDYANEKYVYAINGEGLEKHFEKFQNSDTPLEEIKKEKTPQKKKKEPAKPSKIKKFFGKIFAFSLSKMKNAFGKFVAAIGLVKLGKAISRKFSKSNKTPKVKKSEKLRRRRKLNRKSKEKRSFKNTGFYKFFHKHVAIRVGAIVLAITLAFGGIAYGLGLKKHKPDTNNQTTTSQNIDENNSTIKPLNLDQQNFSNYTFTELLESTKEEKQSNSMAKIGETLDSFNDNFASKYLEQGKDIRAALSWDEASAMKLVYNNYSKEDIQKIYNGAELDKTALSNAYKTGSLQLMGVHVIETRENPVQMESLIDSEEGKAFYAKYHEMFLKASETTGQEQINKVNQFYQELYKDFPIDDKTREEGLAHADGRASIESYKYSIIPMVSAAEMMFQNLAIDHTLSDKAIVYLDDIGVCNLADDTIEKASQVSIATAENKENPVYEEYKEAKIKEQQRKNIYVIDDEHRDLSQLDAFKNKVNVKFEIIDGVFSGEVYYTVTENATSTTKTSTTYSTSSSTEETNDRSRAVDLAGEGNVAGAENAVNQDIEKENQTAKATGESQADQNASNMQKEADEDTAENNKEVADSEKDIQDQLGNANDKIDNKQPVNEDDLGDHNVDFDNSHSNDQGQLDDSVGDLTTDGTGSNNTLPDPNVTGGTFDGQEQNQEQPTTNPSVNESGQNIYEYEEEVGMTNEEKANNIVEQLANASTDNGKAQVYTK